jgi:hypothetical protein
MVSVICQKIFKTAIFIKASDIRLENNVKYTLSIITSHILFGLGASLSLVNYAR